MESAGDADVLLTPVPMSQFLAVYRDRADTLVDFGGSGAVKHKGGDFREIGLVGSDKIGDLRDDDASLARASASDDEGILMRVKDGASLVAVKSIGRASQSDMLPEPALEFAYRHRLRLRAELLAENFLDGGGVSLAV